MKNLRIVFLACALLSSGATSGFAQMAEDEALSKFVAAGIAYKNAQYLEAIKKYNEILHEGDKLPENRRIDA